MIDLCTVPLGYIDILLLPFCHTPDAISVFNEPLLSLWILKCTDNSYVFLSPIILWVPLVTPKSTVSLNA